MHPRYNLRFSSRNGSAAGRNGTPNGQGASLPNGVTNHTIPSLSPSTGTQESEQPPPAAQTTLRAAGSIPSPTPMEGEEVLNIPNVNEQSGTFATATFVSPEHSSSSDDNTPLFTPYTQAQRLNTPPSLSPELASRSRSPIQLDSDQENAVRIAQSNLTRVQKDLIHRRQERVAQRERSSSRGEGTSRRRGKQVDPRNWGSSGIPDNDLDVVAQRRALKLYSLMKDQASKPDDSADQTSSNEDPEDVNRGTAVAHKQSKKDKGSRKKNKKSSERQRSASAPISREFDDVIDKVTGGRERETTSKKARTGEHKTAKHKQSTASRNMKPINQINPDSYLGRALKGAARAKPNGKARYPDSDSDDGDYNPSSSDDESSSSEDSTSGGTDSSDHNSSESSDSSDSSSSDEISSSSEDSSDDDSSDDDSSISSDSDSPRNKRRKKSSSRKRKSHRRRKQGSALKPIEPQSYNGEDDTHLFHKFMTQGTDYVVQGKVEKRRQVAVLSNFMGGKAYTFYTREVSFSKKKWELKKFFRELFNYCFPVDFRMRQRKKLNRCFQNDKSVKEYASELNELFVTIGFSDKREPVHKPWTGLRPSLQKALWIDKLNPETSSWK
ncbi:hypothetical protein EST38_g9404 [Candolleomyces aberdarensis]|uniref:Retrotransposon gag domain-containing protein n=1 Tax=Candolleomyces aberdarensis TaxID=2316362 RepID=A0A4Q2DBR5_9AGAR|nr:hypothetical protein EST38_g9404 [Candolleomyces aberdarensis]